MAYALPCLYVVVTCIVIAFGIPTGSLSLQDNSILQKLNNSHEQYLLKNERYNNITKENKTEDNIGRANDLFPYPLHASCRVQWTFGVDCEEATARLVKQMKLWMGPENCEDGGQKCLYNLTSVNKWILRGTHSTPVAMYVDKLAFGFRRTYYGCYSKSYSYSTVPYALLDYGTNYCNLFNLVDGSGLKNEPHFSETTSNKICTQYTTADCDVY